MVGIRLEDMVKVIAVKRPRVWGLYFKRYSFPKGPIPKHLESYTKSFTSAAGACRPVMTGLRGNEKVIAFNECIGAKLRK